MESSCRCRRLSTFLAYLALTPASVALMTAASSTSAAAVTCTGRHCSFMVYMVQGRASLSTCDDACNSFWRPFMLHRRREDGYRWLLC